MKLERTRISRRTVESLRVEKDTVFWDSELAGFGVRAYPSGSRYYVVQARQRGQPAKRVTVGRHGVLTAEEARRRAGGIIARIKAGEDPSPEPESARDADSPTVREIAERWMGQHVETHCKPKTREMYRLVLEKHLLPALGRRPALSVTHAAVVELHHALRPTPTMANHSVRVLSRMWSAAEARGELPEGRNPCRGVTGYRENRRERFLGEAEFGRLGEALDDWENLSGVSAYAVAAVRLLLLTGCRKNEVLELEWDRVDLEASELKLEDTKTGARTVVLSPEAVAVLEGIPRVKGNPHVIPGQVAGERLKNLNAPWRVICERAQLEDLRIHDLRHSFASRALALGESLPAIGRLLGHRRVETTARYAHLGRNAVREAAVRISNSIAGDVLPGYSMAEDAGGVPAGTE
ncbi:MAG: tyrosine-type recombinase/integrase [Gammaproteobacteria bacterium]|nr:tyrosine-type recombinase/integrase [Gammaproteobacteria bacterium]